MKKTRLNNTTVVFVVIAFIVILVLLSTKKPEGVYIECPEEIPEICYTLYDPVCGKLQLVTYPVAYSWKTFPNDCNACSYNMIGAFTIGYIKGGTCEELGLT